MTNVNEAPVITSDGAGATAAVTAAENSTAVTTVTSTDVDGGDPAYSISGGADPALFTIDPSPASCRSSPRRTTKPRRAGANNVYDVTRSSQRRDGGTDSQAIAVTVTNVSRRR